MRVSNAGRRIGWLVVIGAVLLSPVARGEGAVDLKFRPAKGTVIRLKQTMEQKLAQTMNGQPANATQTTVLGYTFTVEDVAADGTSTVKVNYDAASFKQQGPLGVVEYDSAKPSGPVPQIAKGMAALVGLGMTIKVTPVGRVTAVEGLDAMLDQIIRRLEIPEGPAKAVVEESIRREFTVQAVKDNMETMLLVYPDQPVKVGDGWQRHVTLTKGFPMAMDNAFTLKEASADAATLEVKSTLATDPQAAPIDMGRSKLSYKLTGSATGTIKLNPKDGVTRSVEMTQKVTGAMVNDAGGGRVTDTPLDIETHILMTATEEGK